ncbi:TPA: hypothetical protein I9080_001997 [Clostridium perfringens]|uniref:Uncharacterized protein n=1 Tax=Clostridium perfringens TaxID=1502 RepID=A0A8H9UX82_CLOPF|nr:hypothetical protein [Clostridium perfringens]
MGEKLYGEEAHSNVAILGRCMVTLRVFYILENIKPAEYGGIQLTDIILELMK